MPAYTYRTERMHGLTARAVYLDDRAPDDPMLARALLITGPPHPAGDLGNDPGDPVVLAASRTRRNIALTETEWTPVLLKKVAMAVLARPNSREPGQD